MGWLTTAVVVYGIAVAGGGIMGYVSRGSTQSAISGGIAGLLILMAAALSKSNPRLGFGGTALIAVGLIALFVYRYVQTQSAMPAMAVIALSIVMLFLLIFGHFMAAPAPPKNPKP